MRIITLIENLVYTKGLFAEHGLSYYIDTGNKKILFDSGQGGNFMINAKTLGVNIQEIDAVVISHGHYDHTGGLYPFMQANDRAKLFIKKEAFLPKFHGTDRFIGVTYNPLLLDGRIEYVDRIIEIDKDVFIMPDIPIKNPLDTNFHDFYIRKADVFKPDEFDDELFLAIRRSNGISVISSCSHRGITNIIDAAISFSDLQVDTILGGFHIRHCGASQLEVIILYLERFNARSIGVCHCTGVEKYAELAYHFMKRVFYNHTGHSIEIN